MRLTALLAVALLVATPGLALAANPFAPKPKAPPPAVPVTTVPPATVLDQIDAAKIMMMQFPITDPAFMQQYPQLLALGLSGVYMTASSFDKVTESAVNFQKLCNQKAIRIDASDPFRIAYVWNPGTDTEYTVYLTSLGGMRYVASGDVPAIEKWLKMDPNDPASEASTLRWLNEFTGPAVLFRPSPDMLLLQIGTHRPTLLAKCPS